MIPTYTKDARCDECFIRFTTHLHDENEICPSCRQMKALERIADALETWLGWQ